VHNDAHHRRRQAANISHEVAHGLLLHSPAPLICADGTRPFNREQEDEAQWLGPALLISEDAALFIVEPGQPTATICTTYGASEELLRTRLRVTGALILVARRQAA
jgi:Zn-dependent peptidase ImmA (M78 family)